MLNDLTGKKFGRFTVLRRDPLGKRPTKWVCLCDCGTEKSVNGSNLKRGLSSSCGCYKAELNRAVMSANREAFTGSRLRHGMTANPTHSSWNAMLQRCTNPNRDNYSFYGGRGIKVCERWLVFENFLADMGERPEGMTLDRYPNKDGNYEPGNCRWATVLEQAGNRRKRGPDKNPRKRLASSSIPNGGVERVGKGN